jgi:hypothetical protein
VNPSEIAFLALGIVLGAAIGAAIVEAVRSRPAPRREVRVTIAPNSVIPRRGSTLAVATAGGGVIRRPGSPEDDAWFDGPAATFIATPTMAGSPASMAVRDRTRVLSGPATLRSTAIAVPVDRPSGPPPTRPAPDQGPREDPRPQATRGPDAVPPPASLGAVPRAVAVLEPVATTEPLVDDASMGRTVMIPVIEVGERAPTASVKPRPPVEMAPLVIASAAVGLAIIADDTRPVGRGASSGGAGRADAAAAAALPGADPCGTTRVLMEERCAVASTAAEQARIAAEALREAQRAYDTLRERVERAQADADPRGLAAAKDALHMEFRAATARSRGADDTEAAAREWLTRINELNIRARDALRLAEAGSAELRAALPRLERMGVEADAARISAEMAESTCHEARVQLAACEEAETVARMAAASPAAAAPAPIADIGLDDAPIGEAPADDWDISPGSFERQMPAAALGAYPVIVRILRGDREARERFVATVAAGDPEAERAWQTRTDQLVGAITARAIEDGYLDMPDDDTFWSLFAPGESREIVAALSALGYRYDGAGGFADERVPAQRDLSLAVGYAGLDRMRIRNWPREQELSELYQNANVASDEWLVHHAGDLTLGEMVDALGLRAGNLAEVWNAWGRVRPVLLAQD